MRPQEWGRGSHECARHTLQAIAASATFSRNAIRDIQAVVISSFEQFPREEKPSRLAPLFLTLR